MLYVRVAVEKCRIEMFLCWRECVEVQDSRYANRGEVL